MEVGGVAVRAVGTACASNPVPIVVPCHRVLPSTRRLGNYGGGPERKLNVTVAVDLRAVGGSA